MALENHEKDNLVYHLNEHSCRLHCVFWREYCFQKAPWFSVLENSFWEDLLASHKMENA